uniref:Tumour necrosis receptor-associated factor n=1 Tax=Suberites domuncula TaxID=55567 RepID=Q50IU9_SUBDO|nr:tumour necrosis receptor-associated factor [Suberites domuncula]
MPGYLGAKPLDPSSVKDGMMCVHCKEILKDPLQTDDGIRLCRSCTTEICYPDRAAQKDIIKILVACKYVDLGCTWQGFLKDWELHSAGCICKGVSCPHNGCSSMVAVRHLEGHKLVCPFRQDECMHCKLQLQHNQLEILDHKLNNCHIEECRVCKQKVNRETTMELASHPLKSESGPLTVHLSDPQTTFRHMQTLSARHDTLSKQVAQVKSTLGDVLNDILRGDKSITDLQANHQQFRELCERLSLSMTSVETQFQGLQQELLPGARQPVVDKNLLDRVRELEKLVAERDQVIKKQSQEFVEMKRVVEKLQASCDRNTRHIRQRKHDGETRGPTVGQDKHNEGNHGDDVAPLSRLVQLERRVEDLSRQTTSTQVHVQELELQLQASLASTHNGAFLWRIPNIARRRRDAVEERITSIYSPPFYTGRNGYKMCIRAYLNGDGQGYNTHLSLFFVIMKGEFDNLLKWPFEHKVSMILVDQSHRKHVVQTFKPTPESSSFQQPRSDMNVASGCPQFSKLSIFNDDSYCKEDVMYIKCIVDTTKIFHP